MIVFLSSRQIIVFDLLIPIWGKGHVAGIAFITTPSNVCFGFKIGKRGVDINHHFLHFFDIEMTGMGKAIHCKYVINFTIVRV